MDRPRLYMIGDRGGVAREVEIGILANELTYGDCELKAHRSKSLLLLVLLPFAGFPWRRSRYF